MTSFSAASCPTASPECKVVEVKRRLHGWVGLQRYFGEEDFGIDLIRNGRIIEVQNKDLFIFLGGDRPEREYPIDDQRNRGRFVGEIHLDHCRVSYTKDRFERDDPAWAEMIVLVRGEGPLQPQKARAAGFGPQEAPLYRLFQAFRRSSPQGKTGRWSKILAVRDNDRAFEMAELFYRGEADYQGDERWYALVEEDDRALVGGVPPVAGPGAGPDDVPKGFIDGPLTPTPPGEGQPEEPPITQQPNRQKVFELSRTYKHPLLKVEFNIDAYTVDQSDPDLPAEVPWAIKLEDPGTRTFQFLFNPDNAVFRSMTMTPLDALLVELAFKTSNSSPIQGPLRLYFRQYSPTSGASMQRPVPWTRRQLSPKLPAPSKRLR